MSPEEITERAANCPGWAPGLDIPDGECVNCHAQKREHPKDLQSRASGSPGAIGRAEFALADSPMAGHPSMISPASSAANIRPDVVFCRNCNQGLILKRVEPNSQAESDYACPACHATGPKSKTPTGKLHAQTHQMPQHEKTVQQSAFEDGLKGNAPVAPKDEAYMGWYDEGRRRREADSNAANGAHVPEDIPDGEFEDVPVPYETVTYADGTTATGPVPLPRRSPSGAAAVSVSPLPAGTANAEAGIVPPAPDATIVEVPKPATEEIL